MTGKRFHILMIGLTCLLGLAIIGSVFMANMLLKQQSKKLYDLKLQSQVLTQKQTNLVKAKKDIAKYSELEREARLIVPQDKDQAEAVREIVNVAKVSGVDITAINFPASTLGNLAPNTSAPNGQSSDSTPSTKNNAPTITQTQPVNGLKGVYVMPITVQVANAPVSYASFTKFLSALEQNRRTAQVNSVNIQPVAGSPGQVNFTLVLNVYLKP